MKINFIVLSDLHFGIKRSDLLYNELNEEFISYITKNKIPNCVIVITGDYFDKKITLNDESAQLSIKFMDELYEICKSNEYLLRVILGTKTHDLSQLNIFESRYGQDDSVDFKIIKNVSSEKIFESHKILYVPEEYIENYQEYYSDFFNKKYLMVFGHGTMSCSAFKNQKILSERPIKTAPIFDANLISSLTDNYAVFGHIHVHKKYKNILLPGSFSRWCHGEEKPKGFLHISYDDKKNTSKYDFIENSLAPIYSTLKLDEIEGETIEEKVKSINILKKEGRHIAIKLDEGCKLEDVEILKSKFKEDESLKIKMDGSVLELLNEDDETIEYPFLHETNLNIENKIFKFIKKKYGVKISKEKILEFISPNE